MIAFCIYQDTCGRDIDCYSVAKISEILAGADILSMAIFVTFLHGGLVQCSVGESPPIKAGRPEATTLLEERTTSSRRRTSARSGRSQLLQTLPGQNSNAMLLRMRQHFVDTNVLSMPTSWLHLGFLVPIFCRCLYFVDANILSTNNFCRRLYFVDT